MKQRFQLEHGDEQREMPQRLLIHVAEKKKRTNEFRVASHAMVPSG